MNLNVFYGILIPFIGTSAGAACVFFMKKDLNQWVQRCLTGFAAGVMVAASVWSLLIHDRLTAFFRYESVTQTSRIKNSHVVTYCLLYMNVILVRGRSRKMVQRTVI